VCLCVDSPEPSKKESIRVCMFVCSRLRVCAYERERMMVCVNVCLFTRVFACVSGRMHVQFLNYMREQILVAPRSGQ